MFQRKSDSKTHVQETIIAESVSIDGTFTSDQDVIFAGHMDGNMKIQGSLQVLESARIVGNIEAVDIIIFGTVEGNCVAKGNIEIQESGVLKGDIEVGDKFVIIPGATFLGMSKMAEKITQEEKEETDFDDNDEIDVDFDELDDYRS